MNRFSMEEPDSINKSFEIRSDKISMDVNFDDVNHPEVEAAAETIVAILNKYWNRKLFKENLKRILEKEWKEDE
jgi:hypothetical protein